MQNSVENVGLHITVNKNVVDAMKKFAKSKGYRKGEFVEIAIRHELQRRGVSDGMS